MSDLTATDVMAMKDSGNGNGFSWFWIILIFLFFLGFSGGGLFGGNTNQVNSDFLYRDISGVNQNVSAQGCDTRASVMKANYDNLLGVKDIEYQQAQGFQQSQMQLAQCCCDLKTTVHAEGEQTRALIQQQIIQELRDNLQDAKNTIETTAQTQQLLNTIGKFYVYPAVNPYSCYGCNY